MTEVLPCSSVKLGAMGVFASVCVTVSTHKFESYLRVLGQRSGLCDRKQWLNDSSEVGNFRGFRLGFLSRDAFRLLATTVGQH